MNKSILIIFISIFATSSLLAQKINRQKIKLLKTSFITDAINLTPDEAEKFWPVYNLYSDEMRGFRNAMEKGLMQEYKLSNGIDNITEVQAQQFLARVQDLEQEIMNNKISMVQDLSKIISAKKIVKLHKAERDFNRRMLQEYGRRNSGSVGPKGQSGPRRN
jgi:hypothetical protein